MDKHNAQEVLELTAAAMRADMRALEILDSTLEQPDAVQLDAFIDKLTEYAQEVQERTGEQLAFSLPDYNAALDPAGPAFDPAAYRQAIDAAGGWPAFKAELKSELRGTFGKYGISRAAAEAFKNSPGAKAAAQASKGLAKAIKQSPYMREVAKTSQVINKALLDALKSPEMQARLKEIQEIAEETAKLRNKYEPYFIEAWPKFAEAPDFIKDVAFSLILELDIAQEAGQYKGVTVPEVLDAGYNSEWEKIEGSPFFDLLTVAERGAALFPTLDRLQALQKALEEAQKGNEEAALIKAGQLTFDGLYMPLDKMTNVILQAGKYDEAGKYGQEISKMGGNVPNVRLVITIDDKLRNMVDRPLTYRRAMVLSAWYNLLLAGATSWTVDDIIKWTGKRNINAEDRKAYQKEIEILAATNFRAEQEGFGTGEQEKPHFAAGQKLISYDYVETDKIGKAGGSIRYYPKVAAQMPKGGPLLAFAERLGQVTYYPAPVLLTESTKNETTYKREYYLRNRVAKFRNATPKEQKAPYLSKIKFDTYFEKIGLTGNTQSERNKRTREKKYIYSLLDEWTEINWIGGYIKSREAITLLPPKPGGLKVIENPAKKTKKKTKK